VRHRFPRVAVLGYSNTFMMLFAFLRPALGRAHLRLPLKKHTYCTPTLSYKQGFSPSRTLLAPRLHCALSRTASTLAMSTAEFSEEWLTGPSSTTFYSRIYTPAAPPRAALVFVHGFIEHVGRYAHVFPHWRAADIAVLAYDQRGFGRTALDATRRSPGSAYGKTGSPEQRADLQFVLGEARRRWPGVPLFLMGHSMVRRCNARCSDDGSCACRAAASYFRTAPRRRTHLRSGACSLLRH
jgi:pimeloyl-ACP methyl ester carboxylesterase